MSEKSFSLKLRELFSEIEKDNEKDNEKGKLFFSTVIKFQDYLNLIQESKEIKLKVQNEFEEYESETTEN